MYSVLRCCFSSMDAGRRCGVDKAKPGFDMEAAPMVASLICTFLGDELPPAAPSNPAALASAGCAI